LGEVGGRKVEHDAIDLAGIERGLRRCIVVVHLRIIVRLDDVVEVIETGRADRRAEAKPVRTNVTWSSEKPSSFATAYTRAPP